jgi:hypothetical protein
MAQRLFVFLQMEFPWVLGPAEGRYLLREQAGGEPHRVVVFDALSTGRAGTREAATGRPSMIARLGGRAGAGAPASPAPAEVTTSRATVIDPISLSAESQARAWLDGIDVEHELLAATAVVNRVLHFHRIASADAYVNEVSPAQAIVRRAGWGEGEQVAGGRWLHARELPWAASARRTGGRLRGGGRARSSALRPQERLAQLLGARGTTLVCEELALRARLDLDQGRSRHAAVELDSALSMAVSELRGEGRPDLAIRVAELEQLHAGVAEQARAALPGAASTPDVDVLRHALERLEAALRARSATGFARS